MEKLICWIGFILFCTNTYGQAIGFTGNSKVLFNPEFEGIYSLKITCMEPSPKCQDALFANIDRLTIINGSRNLGTWVTIASQKNGDVIDTFIAANVGPTENKVSGTPHLGSGFGEPEGRFAYFDLHVDESQQTFTGVLVDSQTTLKYAITGNKIRISKDITKSVQTTVNLQNIIGSYTGNFGDFKGTLHINELPDGRIIGFFSGDEKFMDASVLTFNYITGHWDTATGILKLVFVNQKFTSLGELVLSAKIQNQKTILEGFQFTTFADYPVKMIQQ